MKSTIKLLLVASLLIGSGQLMARGIPGDAPPLAVLKVTLELTEVQLEDTVALVQERQVAIASLADELEAAKQQLEAATGSDDPDPAEVGTLVLDIQSLKQELAGQKASYAERFEALLSDEQLTRLKHITNVGFAVRAAQALNEVGFR